MNKTIPMPKPMPREWAILSQDGNRLQFTGSLPQAKVIKQTLLRQHPTERFALFLRYDEWEHDALRSGTE